MFHHIRGRALILLLVCSWAGSALAQRAEVRTFLAPTGPVIADGSYLYLQSCIKQRYVCPYCSFSRWVPALGATGTETTCPNPWGITGHPNNVPLVDTVGTGPDVVANHLGRMGSRLLSLSGPDMPDDRADLDLPDAANGSHPKAVLGRPFKPLDGAVNDRSGLFAEAANLVNTDGHNGPIIRDGSHGRFLVIPPSAYRRELPAGSTASGAVPARRVMARVDDGSENANFAPSVLANDGLPIAPAALTGTYLRIGVNPYRVDDGDYWFVRYTETHTGANVTEAIVEICSLNYGWDGDVDPSGNPVELHIVPTGTVQYPFSVISKSGAIRLTFLTPWSPNASHTWTVGFMTRSTCRLVPGWRDMVTNTDPPYWSLDDGTQHNTPGFDLLNDDFPDPKACSFAIDNAATPTFTTESQIEEPGEGQPLAVILPPDTIGQGTVAVEWAGDPTGDWTPAPAGVMNANTTYYVEDGQWEYDAYFEPSTGTTADVTNVEVANQTDTNFTPGAHEYVQLLASHFMCTSVETLPTNHEWRPDPAEAYLPVEIGAFATWRYPRAVIGWLSGTSVQGSYAPGSNTQGREVAVRNRWDAAEAASICPTCGAVWAVNPPDVCPYHTPSALRVEGAGTVGCDGTYAVSGSAYNGRPVYVLDGAHVIFFGTSNRWLLGPSVGANLSTCYYRGMAATVTLPAMPWTAAPAGAAPAPTVTLGGLSELAPEAGGALTLGHGSWREAATYSVDEVAGSAGRVRQTMASEAFRTSGVTVPHDGMRTEQISVAIPRHQAPSVPGTGAVNDLAADRGYRGGQVLHQNLTPPNANSGLTDGWDTFYLNPDTGYYQPAPGVWPFECPQKDYVTWGGAGNCPRHGVATVEVPGRHYFCKVCGSEFPTQPVPPVCPFDGDGVTNQISAANAVREEHLTAENFDPIDVQVSVLRQTEFVQATAGAAMGRTSPGVPPRQPDANSGILNNHVAYPSNMTPVPALTYSPSDARVLLANDGNVRLQPTISGSYLPSVNALADRGLDHYLRLEVDPFAFSYGRKALSGPLTRDTFYPLYAPPQSATVAAAEHWLSVPGATTEAAGALSGGFLAAGAARKPVPLGQPVGTYTGAQLQYVDLNGNGYFDFEQHVGNALNATTTETNHYNPSVDLPLEPLAGLLQGQARVFESRLPQNDFYAADSDPVVLPSPTAGVMQVIWATNRPSTAAGAANPGAAGATPADLPASDAGVNLVYVTSDFNGGGLNDPLYRNYRWQTDGTGLLLPPSVMTTDGPGTVNGVPWAMTANDGSRWAFWHRSLRHAGGVESTLRYESTTGIPWPTTSQFIYDTSLPKLGLRGFFPPGRTAWMFWHSGNPGRERLMYRWDFSGTGDHNEAPLPVTNQAPAGAMSDLIRAVLPDGSNAVIRRPSGTPFTYTKDVSVDYINDTVNVFFSGFVTAEGQADICQTRYSLSVLGSADRALREGSNYGKLPYGRVTDGEEMQPDALHERFGSRHLDWMVDDQFEVSGPGGPVNPNLTLELAFRDVIGDGAPQPSLRFGIDWTNGRYDRATGIYTVTPVLYPAGGATLELYPAGPALAGPTSGSWYLVDPNSLTGANAVPRPLRMEINTAAGTVRFTSPLFNEDAPDDRTTVLRASYTYSVPNLEDVVLHANYTPYVYRVTRDEAQDDAPSAFYDRSTAQRLTVFWRRTYPNTDAPHFGRPAFMYKVFTTAVQVGHPPMGGNATVTGYTGAAPTQDLASGLINAGDDDIHHYLRVEYTDADGADHVERHQVIGWSREMLVPIATVVGEGSLVAVPEAFTVNNTEAGGGTDIPAVRYWLFWSSPRGVYDLRLVEGPRGRVAPFQAPTYDVAIHPSTDVYTAVVAPEYGSLVPEREVPTVTNDNT